jgi:threonine aldolase
MTERLEEDHENAKVLADKIAASGTLEIDPSTVETNICIFTVPGSYSGGILKLIGALENEGLLVTWMGENMLRMVTHYDYRGDWNDQVVKRLGLSLKA